MKPNKRYWIIWLAVAALLSLTLGCGPISKLLATATPVPTNTPLPTNTPVPTNTPIPTNTPLPTSTPLPTNTPLPEPTATTAIENPPTPADMEEGLVILTHNGFFSDSGAALIVGEVYNNDTVSYQYVEIVADLQDEAGNTLSTENTYAYVDIIAPGEKSPFMITIYEPPAGLDQYDVVANGDTTDESMLSGLEFDQYADEIDDDGDWKLIGEVVNNSDAIAGYVQVVATLFDANDEVAGVGFSMVESSLMDPGDISPFTLYVTDIYGEVDRFEIQVYGTEADSWQLESWADMEMVSIDYYVDEWDDLVVVGEVKNNSSSNVSLASIFGSFYDENDNIVDVEWGFAWADVIPPGGVSPFDLQLYDTPDTVDHWTVWVEGTTTEDEPEGNLVLTDSDFTVSDGAVTFTGTIANQGTETMEYIEVAATIYNADGDVVMVGWDWLEGELAPNGTMPFEFGFDIPEEADHFELYVQGSVQSE